MRKKILLLFVSSWSMLINAQTEFTKNYESVRTELMEWDVVRGEWLANSLEAMAVNQAIPERTFPEDVTPQELYAIVPKNHQAKVESIVEEKRRNAESDAEKRAWRKIASTTNSGACKAMIARSYGDPHIKTFDGASYSFQTVGEFSLAKSASNHMEVQARQKAQTNDFSLNTAVAMNVSGDRVCIYAEDKPLNTSNAELYINGNPQENIKTTTFLSNGGSIVKQGKNDYIINWPSGEKVVIDFRNSGSMRFLNIRIEILPCNDEQFIGVMGNANNFSDDDIRTKSGRNPKQNPAVFASDNPVSKQMEREYLNFLAKEFADDWRVNDQTTLFDYPFGTNTLAFTDYSFPKVHRTLNDLPQNQRDRARRDCENQGILGDDLNGCIFDRAYLDITPAKPVVARNRTEGMVLSKIDPPSRRGNDNPSNPRTNNSSGSEEIIKNTNEKSSSKTSNENNKTKPSIENEEKVSTTPKDTEKYKEIENTPAPQPIYKKKDTKLNESIFSPSNKTKTNESKGGSSIKIPSTKNSSTKTSSPSTPTTSPTPKVVVPSTSKGGRGG